jgi:hypothetical protein
MTSWDDATRYVEPVVREINQPTATLLHLTIVLHGDGQEAASYEFRYDEPTPERNAALLRHAASLVQDHAERIGGHDSESP